MLVLFKVESGEIGVGPRQNAVLSNDTQRPFHSFCAERLDHTNQEATGARLEPDQWIKGRGKRRG